MDEKTEPAVVDATVREALNDEIHIECRFRDGQKFAAVRVAEGFDGLAHKIAALLSATAIPMPTTGPASGKALVGRPEPSPPVTTPFVLEIPDGYGQIAIGDLVTIADGPEDDANKVTRRVLYIEGPGRFALGPPMNRCVECQEFGPLVRGQKCAKCYKPLSGWREPSGITIPREAAKGLMDSVRSRSERSQIETCETSGHVWQRLTGGQRCSRCGEQVIEPVTSPFGPSDDGQSYLRRKRT